MRTDISAGWLGWFYKLDFKKIIIVVFLLRLITASAYDIFVTVTDKEILLPDSKYYSVRGRYVDLLLQGYEKKGMTKDLLPRDKVSADIFIDTMQHENNLLPPNVDESKAFSYIIGAIYLVLGHSTIWVRIFNICLSMVSVYLFFVVARRYFGELTAKLFLLLGLLLPTQFGYSITFARDFIRVFMVSFAIWLIYMIGDLWLKRSRSRYCC